MENFRDWLKNVAYYHQDSILDDNILLGYEREFYEDFNILDIDADYKSFDYRQQILLDQFLENCLNNFDEVKTDENEEVIDNLKSDIKCLQSELTHETKNSFMRKLSKIFAKARKSGLKISGFIMKEFAKEVFKESTRLIFEFAINHTQEITKYIHI